MPLIYIYCTYPLLHLLLPCCDISATSADNCNVLIEIRYKQKLSKRLAEIKRKKIKEEKLNAKTQSIYRLYLLSTSVAAAVL